MSFFSLRTSIVESVEAYQRSFDRGIQMGHQRRNKVSLITVLWEKNIPRSRISSVTVIKKSRVRRWPHNLMEGFFLKDKLRHFFSF